MLGNQPQPKDIEVTSLIHAHPHVHPHSCFFFCFFHAFLHTVAKKTSNNGGADHREQAAHSASKDYSNIRNLHPYFLALYNK